MAIFAFHNFFLPLLLGLIISSVVPLAHAQLCLSTPLDVFDYGSSHSTTISSAGPNLARAQTYVYLVGATYCANTSLSAWNCQFCNQAAAAGYNYYTVLLNNTADTMALVTVNTNPAIREIVVTFRGSYNVPNFVCDAILVQASSNDDSGVMLHQGFYGATMSLYSQVVNTVNNLLTLYPNYNLVFSGHSLGAAEATITAYMMSSGHNFPDNGTSISPASWSLFTYGEPRPGNKVLADYFNTKSTWNITRVTNNADIVPHNPPVKLNYMHHGTELWTGTGLPLNLVGSIKSKSCSKSLYEDPCCSNSMGPVFDALDHLTYFNMNVITCDASNPTMEGLSFLGQFIFGFSGNCTVLPTCLTDFTAFLTG